MCQISYKLFTKKVDDTYEDNDKTRVIGEALLNLRKVELTIMIKYALFTQLPYYLPHLVFYFYLSSVFSLGL